MALYAVIWSYTDDTSVIDAARAAHGAYVAKLAAEGSLREAGAWGDGSGALLVFDSADEQHLAALLDADPYKIDGVVSAEAIHLWKPGLGLIVS